MPLAKEDFQEHFRKTTTDEPAQTAMARDAYYLTEWQQLDGMSEREIALHFLEHGTLAAKDASFEDLCEWLANGAEQTEAETVEDYLNLNW